MRSGYAYKVCALALAVLMMCSPASADPRIRDVVYSPDKVIQLTGHFGYQIAVEFPDPDRIESVAVGDSLIWQVTPNKRGNILFLKPVDEGGPTNMTVVTSGRYYTFELNAKRRVPNTPSSEITYLLRIAPPQIEKEETAPEPVPLREPSALQEQRPVNDHYTYKGSTHNLPSRVYDDGVSTMFEWPQGVETPAIFYLRTDGSESIVNFSYDGNMIVVHQVAAEFILRNGKEVTRIFNEGFAEIDRGPLAPLPKKKKGGLFGLFGN